MNQSCSTYLYFLMALAAVAVILSPTPTDGKCNSCGEYGIACLNETSFYMCTDGNADKGKVFNCPLGKICSSLSLKCVEANMGSQPDCAPNKGCGICDGTKMFACTSRTTYAQCNGSMLTNNTAMCPQGYTCASSNVEICANECNVPAIIECDRESPL